MNKHKKLAIFIAPILIVLGYIGSDYYLQYEAEKSNNLYILAPEGQCDILSAQCILSSGEFKVNLLDKEGVTTVNSTFPLDAATLFLVDKNNIAVAYPLKKDKTTYYWSAETPLRALTKSTDNQKLRLILNIKGGQYISEFYHSVEPLSELLQASKQQ